MAGAARADGSPRRRPHTADATRVRSTPRDADADVVVNLESRPGTAPQVPRSRRTNCTPLCFTVQLSRACAGAPSRCSIIAAGKAPRSFASHEHFAALLCRCAAARRCPSPVSPDALMRA